MLPGGSKPRHHIGAGGGKQGNGMQRIGTAEEIEYRVVRCGEPRFRERANLSEVSAVFLTENRIEAPSIGLPGRVLGERGERRIGRRGKPGEESRGVVRIGDLGAPHRCDRQGEETEEEQQISRQISWARTSERVQKEKRHSRVRTVLDASARSGVAHRRSKSHRHRPSPSLGGIATDNLPSLHHEPRRKEKARCPQRVSLRTRASKTTPAAAAQRAALPQNRLN